MDRLDNPNLGTRQYPYMGSVLIPVTGYSSGMEPVDIGREVREARERKRWSQEELAERAGGIGQSTIDRIEKGQFKRMPSHLPVICSTLGIPLPEFGSASPPPGRPIPANRIFGRRDFPVHTAAEGGPGEILVETDPIDFIPRPGPLEHVRDAYGLVITGTSMIPEYRPGETALVNPRMPVIPGEIYIFYAEKEGEARATIKQLVRATEREWRVEQHNPPTGKPREFVLPRREWRWAHRVVGKHART
jgi:transcriptional regulator with XRE-family HTH domain